MEMMDIIENGISSQPTTVVHCPDCDKEFVHPRNLQQHRRVQHEGLRYYCQDCDQSYTRQYNLTHHRLKTHPDKIPPEEAAALRKKYASFRYIYPINDGGTVSSAPNTPNNSSVKEKPASTANNNNNNAEKKSAWKRMSTGNLLRLGLTKRTTDDLLAPPKGADGLPIFHSPSPPDSGSGSDSRSGSGSAGRKRPPKRGRTWLDNTNKYRCMLCPFSTDSIDNLRGHASKHAKLQPSVMAYQCKFCDFGTNSENTLYQHCGTHFEWVRWSADKRGDENADLPRVAPILRCINCDRLFKDAQLLQAHEALHHLEY